MEMGCGDGDGDIAVAIAKNHLTALMVARIRRWVGSAMLQWLSIQRGEGQDEKGEAAACSVWQGKGRVEKGEVAGSPIR